MKTLKLYMQYWFVRLLFLIFIALIGFGSYFYSIPEFTWGTLHIKNLYYTKLENMPTWLYVAEYFIFTFLIVSVLLLVLITLYKKNKRIRKKIRGKYTDYFATALVCSLYSDREFCFEVNSLEAKAFKKALRDDYAKRIFIDEIRRVRVQTIGVVREKTLKVFEACHFDYLIRAYLHSPYLRKKLFALKVIADLQLEGYEDYIIRLTRQKNNVLHSEALVTLIKLNIYDNLLLLVKLKTKLTVWDINIIAKTSVDLNKKDIDYSALIQSGSPEVTTLGIMLVRLNERKELKMEVMQKIGDTNELVNEEAFLAFVFFVEDRKDYEFLIERFELATEKAQISIIKAIATYPDKSAAIRFLEWVVVNKSFKHKLEALHVLLELELSAVAQFRRSNDPLIRQVCSQVLDINT